MPTQCQALSTPHLIPTATLCDKYYLYSVAERAEAQKNRLIKFRFWEMVQSEGKGEQCGPKGHLLNYFWII